MLCISFGNKSSWSTRCAEQLGRRLLNDFAVYVGLSLLDSAVLSPKRPDTFRLAALVGTLIGLMAIVMPIGPNTFLVATLAVALSTLLTIFMMVNKHAIHRTLTVLILIGPSI